MNDVASYENNPLIQEIREEYGGPISQGTTETTGTIQKQLRSSVPKSRATRGKAASSKRRTSRSAGRPRRDDNTTKGSNSGKGRTNTATNKVSGGTDSSNQPTDTEIQQPTIEELYEEKPSGLDAIPNAKERKIREEQEQDKATRSSSKEEKKGFFSWLHSDNRTGRTERKQGRGKPFSEREAEEIRPALLAALLDTFVYTDELIYATHKAHNHVMIWRSIDEEEAGILIDTWLMRARHNAKAAAHIETLVERHHELKVGLILAPRFYQTFRAYVEGGGFSVR